MKVEPKSGLLLIKKHKNTRFSVDMAVTENDEDKRLITGEVLFDKDGEYTGQTVIFGKYAILDLTIQGEDFHILDKEDMIGTCDYKE